MRDILAGTAQRLEQWRATPEVLGVVLVGSASRGHSDELSDDDLEVYLSEEAWLARAPGECIELLIEGEGDAARLIYDSQYTAISDLERKLTSPHDLDHWPYERARVLFDRTGRVSELVNTLGGMDADFRSKRLHHATIDTSIAVNRAAKTRKRNFKAAEHLLVARGAKALSRLLFALEWRWVPLDHWLEPEVRTLKDPTQAGICLLEALRNGTYEPLREGLNRLQERLIAGGVPPLSEMHSLFLELIHPSRAAERAIHGLY
jgi:predicted nucleotidyltransferase